MKKGTITNVSITDPDISGRIDALLVQKTRTSNNSVVQSWNLVNYQSTDDIDLKNGNFYLKIFPYYINIDPLPVWFKVGNNGTENLTVQCIITEGKHGFKNIKKLGSGESMDVAGCYRLEYRVVRFSLGNLGIQLIDGIGRTYRNKLVAAGIMRINDLCGKKALEVSKNTGIPVIRLAEWIRKAEIAISIHVSGEKYKRIAGEKISVLLRTPINDLMKKVGRTKKEIEGLMDVLGNLTVTIDDKYMKNMRLENLFDGKSMDITGYPSPKYRVMCLSLGSLDVQFIDGVGRISKDKLHHAGITKVADMVGKEALELSRAVHIPIMKLAEYIRKAEIACSMVSSKKYERIAEEKIVDLLNTSVDDLIRKTRRTKKEIEELMNVLENLTVAIDARYLKNMSLKNLL